MPPRKSPAAGAATDTPPAAVSAPAPKSKAPRAARKATKATAARKPAARARATAAPKADALDAALARLEQVAARFEAGCDRLSRALDEMPRPDDFQPLADHLYEFARTAPPLLESLQDVPRAVAPIQESVRALEQLAETLSFTHTSFDESLLRLPRAEDYEPLAAPLAEFARVSPALRESLAEVLRVARPLGAAVEEMECVSRDLRATERRLSDALTTVATPAADAGDPPAPAPPAAAADGHVHAAARAAAACMLAARQAILDALATLPREPAYGALARQLRELATVSPSLMDWLAQTPALIAPLSASVEALQAGAAQLAQGQTALAEALGGSIAVDET